MIKNNFESLLTEEECQKAQTIIDDAHHAGVNAIINVGTNLLESINSVKLAQLYAPIFATIGIHPNDAREDWHEHFKELEILAREHVRHKIVAMGECGIDRHYPDYHLTRQQDVFRAHITCALEYDLALIIHTRDAEDETLKILDEFSHEPLRGVFHCFSGDLSFAHEAIKRGFVLGIGGTITYPKNNIVRDVVRTLGERKIILETDSPYLPPQSIRGKPNSPAQIKTIAEYCAQLLGLSVHDLARATSSTSRDTFRLDAR